jgi:hypothetical protein
MVLGYFDKGFFESVNETLVEQRSIIILKPYYLMVIRKGTVCF